MRLRSLLMLAAGMSLACTAGAQTGLQVKVAFPGFHTQAIPASTRAVPILVFHDGKLIEKTILTPRNPGALFRGLPTGGVEVFAAGFARGGMPTAVGKGNADIQPATLAKAEIVMRETSADAALDKFRPFLDEIKQHIEREFPEASPSPDVALSPLPTASTDPVEAPSIAPTATATATPAPGGAAVSPPTIGTLTAFAYAPDTYLPGFVAVAGGSVAFGSNDLKINGVDVGAMAATPGGNTPEQNAQAIATVINASTPSHRVKAGTDGAGKVVLIAKNIDINLQLSATGIATTGITNVSAVTVPKNAMNYYSGYPIVLKAPFGGAPTGFSVTVVNGGRTATYVYNGSQWLVTNPDPLTNSPITLIGSGEIVDNSTLAEGHFGAPILAGGNVSLIWQAPTIVGPTQTFNISVDLSNAGGADSSPALSVVVAVPPTSAVNTDVAF